MTDRETLPVDRLFQALADPWRREFVEHLAHGPASVKEIAATAQIQLPAVLKHLRILEDGGILVSEKVGRVRTYRLRQDAFEAADRWMRARQAELNQAFDRLAALMTEVPEERDQ